MKLAAVVALLVAFPAFAAKQVSVNVGKTKVVAVSQKVAKVVVSNPEVVQARQERSAVSLTGRESGKALVQIRTVDGVEVDLMVHVTQGGDIYMVGR